MGRILPVLFNTEMVRAILDGRKTATRRIMKPQPILSGCFWEIGGAGWSDNISSLHPMPCHSLYNRMPFHAGDILYVRETYCPDYFDYEHQYGNRHGYKADYEKAILTSDIPEPKWIPSIHMPKQAARIWLKITEVRVERLQDITEEQAESEGAIDNRGFIHSLENEYDDIHSARDHFAKIWDSTIKKADIDKYGWHTNPWIWVIEFERCEAPAPCIIKGIEPASDKRPCIGYQKSKEDDEPCEMCKGCKQCDGEEPEREGL